jgi:hypothetical protein
MAVCRVSTYAAGMAGTSWGWREAPVLEAVLRLARTGDDATPEAIAYESILHVEDVHLAIESLASGGYVSVVPADGDDIHSPLVVTPTLALRRRR